MVCVNDRAKGRDSNVVTDRNRTLAYDVNALFDQDPIANAKVRIPTQVRPMNDLQSCEVANLAVITDADSAGIGNEQRLEKHGSGAKRA